MEHRGNDVRSALLFVVVFPLRNKKPWVYQMLFLGQRGAETKQAQVTVLTLPAQDRGHIDLSYIDLAKSVVFLLLYYIRTWSILQITFGS